MKKNVLFLLSLCLVILSCSDDTVTDTEKEKTPSLTINQKEITISDEGGSQSITFESNMSWTAKSSESWCDVSPSSGNETSKGTSINISKNDTNSDRNCTLTINVGNISKNITITQHHKQLGVYWVTKMGTLGTILNQTQKDTITTMVVKGEINKTDFEVMKKWMPNLKHLDLEKVKCEYNKIPDKAFGDDRGYFNSPINKYIKTIIFPESITAIGNMAFSGCTGLTGSLTLPNGLTTIEANAFSGCTGLTGSLTLPNGLTTIEKQAFFECTGLTGSLTLPNGLTTIENSAFSYCTGLTGSLILPESITAIGIMAFYHCTGLTGSLTLPNGLTTIEAAAFSGCTGLTGSLTLPNGLTTIEEDAFRNCGNISGKITFPVSLKSIGSYGFYKCNKIESFRFRHTTPLSYNDRMFPTGATIEVPSSVIARYKESRGWKDYNIVGF